MDFPLSENLTLQLRHKMAVGQQVFGVAGHKQWRNSILTVAIVLNIRLDHISVVSRVVEVSKNRFQSSRRSDTSFSRK
jgi:hypothetical protein